jgi:uncharacterized repeat protein (TIGR01451 family)
MNSLKISRFIGVLTFVTAALMSNVAFAQEADVSDLSITKTDGVVEAIAGATTLTYIIVASNAGPSDAMGAVITDTFPTELENCSYTASSISVPPATGFTAADSGDISDTVDMPVGSSIDYEATCDVAASVADGTALFNNASIQPNPVDIDPDTGNNRDNDDDTIVTRVSDLSLTKTGSPDPLVAAGTQLTYTLLVYNDGPSDATGVQIVDELPEVVSFVSASTGCAHLLGIVTCDLPPIANDSFSSAIQIVVGVPVGYFGDILNDAVVTSASTDPNPDNNAAIETTQAVPALPSGDTALIAVQKFFTDGNDETPVTLTLQCTSGSYAPATVMVDPDDFAPGSAFEHIFVIGLIPEGTPNPCTVVELPVPDYDPTYICGQDGSTSTVDDTLCNQAADFSDGTTACGWLDVQTGDSNLCGIFNRPTPVDVDVHKVWEIVGAEQADFDPDVTITLNCDARIVGGYYYNNGIWRANSSLYESDGDFDDEDDEYTGMGIATFEVIPEFYSTADDPEDQEYTECWATENIQDNAVEVTNGCIDLEVAAGMGDECTITNTVFFEGIPTLNQYGMAIMALLMLGVGLLGFRRFV